MNHLTVAAAAFLSLASPRAHAQAVVPSVDAQAAKIFWEEILAVKEPVLLLGDSHVFASIRSELAAQMRLFKAAGFTHFAFEAFDGGDKGALERLSKRHCAGRLCSSCRDSFSRKSRLPSSLEGLPRGAADGAPPAAAACKEGCAASVCPDCARDQAVLCEELKDTYQPEGDTALFLAALEAGLKVVALEEDHEGVVEKLENRAAHRAACKLGKPDCMGRDCYAAAVLAGIVKADPSAKIAAFVGGRHAQKPAQPEHLAALGVASRTYMFLYRPLGHEEPVEQFGALAKAILTKGFYEKRLLITSERLFDGYLSIPAVINEAAAHPSH